MYSAASSSKKIKLKNFFNFNVDHTKYIGNCEIQHYTFETNHSNSASTLLHISNQISHTKELKVTLASKYTRKSINLQIPLVSNLIPGF